MDYTEFLDAKVGMAGGSGFEALWLPDYLFDFQSSLVTWALRRGRAALFEDCGLGKTIQELVFAENIRLATDRDVLLATPLAVSYQIVEEAAKFGIEVHRVQDGVPKRGINVTNYERLSRFNPDDFAALICDESSILKNFDGARKTEVTEFMKRTEYGLLGTATAAPNDYIELGTSSEALGELGHVDMLSRFFKHVDSISAAGGAA